MIVRYKGGTGFVLGVSTQTNYGQKSHGDVFPVFAADYNADKDKFEIVNANA